MVLMSLAEILAEPPRRSDWGPWRLDVEHYVLFIPFDPESDSDDHTDGFRYYVTVDECTTSARALDWIMQVAGKTWADNRTLAGLVRALDDVLGPQATLCSWGQPGSLTQLQIREHVHEVAKWAA